MKKLTVLFTVLLVGVFLFAGNAIAATIGISVNSSEQTVDEIIQMPLSSQIDDGGYYNFSRFEILAEEAGWKDTNKFGYYTLVNGKPQRTGIFSGSDAVGAVGQLSGVGEVGVYITSQHGTFYSDPSLNSDGYDHFAVFAENGVYYLAIEDQNYNARSEWWDQDHNDLVIKATATPIPGAVWLLGSGLVGLVGVRRFRRS
jgi:hypothetical protein